eukprot:TRINITY_DN19437_c0_g2_i1.p1 TRINITY_DN19437_c0_g2~~TRINITY_DN19437_c0_g2_i1.p1  ORF type:complete len:584 (+),score=54.73 TRINITY_DN19437_c0_g2_i1:90-1841(+)
MDTTVLQYAGLWLLRAIIVGVVLIYVWSCRSDLMRFFAFPWLYLKSHVMAPADPGVDALAIQVEKEFQELRLDRLTTAFKWFMPVLTCLVLVSLVTSMVADTLDGVRSTVSLVCFPGPLYIVGIFVANGRWSLSRWHLDAVLAYVYANMSVRVLLYRVGVVDQSYVATSRLRACGQSFVTLLSMDFRKSSWANLFMGVVEVLAYVYRETEGTSSLDETTGQIIAREIGFFAITMITAYFCEDAARLLVRRNIETRTSEAGERAVESILEVLCDAVVRLGVDMRLLRDCPPLGHMLLTGIKAEQAVDTAASHCNFLQHLVEDDRKRFTDFLSLQSKKARECENSDVDSGAAFALGPSAINVSLRDTLGSIFKVQLIHAHLRSLDGDGHLIGIRDLGDPARKWTLGASEGYPTTREAGSQTLRSDSSCDASGTSISFGSCDLRPHSMKLLVDVFDERYPVHEMVLALHDPSTPKAHLPLSSLLSLCSYSALTGWLTTTVNDLAYGRASAPMDDVTFFSHHTNASMRAGRARARVEGTVGIDLFKQDSCLVTLGFEDIKGGRCANDEDAAAELEGKEQGPRKKICL